MQKKKRRKLITIAFLLRPRGNDWDTFVSRNVRIEKTWEFGFVITRGRWAELKTEGWVHCGHQRAKHLELDNEEFICRKLQEVCVCKYTYRCSPPLGPTTLTLIWWYIPRTQMTLVLIGKGLVFEGWTSKIEVSRANSIYMYILYISPFWQEGPMQILHFHMG